MKQLPGSITKLRNYKITKFHSVIQPGSSSVIRPKPAFTLIEVLMVVAIIGILAALTVTNMVGALAKSRDAKRKTYSRSIASALEQYAQDHSLNYPGGYGPGGSDISFGGATALNGQLVPTYIATNSIFTHDKAARYVTDFVNTTYAMAWELEALTEATVNSSNGIYSTNSANVAGVVTTPLNVKGTALSFSGGVSTVSVPSHAAYQTAAFSVAFWVNSSDVSGTQAIVYRNAGGVGWRISLVNAGPTTATLTADYQGGSGTSGTGGTIINQGSWYHVVVTYASGSVIVYVNGSSSGGSVGSMNFNNATNANQLKLGDVPGGSGWTAFNGSVDDLRLFNRVLTPTEVGLLWNNSYSSYGTANQIATGALVGGWRFDEGVGTGLVLLDYSPTANHGTLNWPIGAPSPWITGVAPLGLTPIGNNLLGRAFLVTGPP